MSGQGPWIQRASIPGPARHRGFAFTVGQRGYFGCGWNGVTMYSDCWEYDPSTDTWMQKSNYPGGQRLSPFAFAIGNKGYVGCGLDASLYGQPDFYEFNPATNTWTMKAQFTGTPVFGASTCVWNGTAIIMFGDDWAPNYWKHNEIYSYNATTNAWAYVGQFPGDGRRDHVAFNINNKIYFGTGNNNSYTELNDWWEWNPATGIMTPKATFIGSARSQAVGFAIGGRAYVGTGGIGDERDFFQYNPVTNTWQGIDEFAGAGRENSMSFEIGARAYIIAGTSGINYNDCWEFNPNLVTGIGENTSNAVISIYPNPVTELVNIRLNNEYSGKLSYSVFNSAGQLILHSEIMSDGMLLTINVSDLAAGIYSIELSGEDWTASSCFVK